MTDKGTTLLVLAAGMGSRYGGLKQLDPLGPTGETVLDYSVHDAVRAGFTRVVFVIRREMEAAFHEGVGKRYADKIGIDYAFQELEDVPAGFSVPAERSKPWGTAHAVRAARDRIAEPFAVINADDFYGAEAFAVMAEELGSAAAADPLTFSMVGYPLRTTLSPHGTVNRGLCETRDGLLRSVTEYTEIQRRADGTVAGIAPDGATRPLDPETPVSMNFWGLLPEVFPLLEQDFEEFLRKDRTTPKAEWYLPAFIDGLLTKGTALCRVLPVETEWFGITYPEDKPEVQAAIRRMIEAGRYTSPLS
ncbi:MAG: NTP transferase domain-containing protein [Verrucomicrobia bacterium]|jgi:NDP-sugar pyrophosphorylase family protein|nr:NTP transferase domain-containing protein [Verrucomicrobiota bacterium]